MKRKNNYSYQIPGKPKTLEEQMSMVWDFCFNHLPSRLNEMERHTKWQDIKFNFTLVLLALILGALAAKLFGG